MIFVAVGLGLWSVFATWKWFSAKRTHLRTVETIDSMLEKLRTYRVSKDVADGLHEARKKLYY